MSRRRIILPVDGWPEPDRKAWYRALTPGDLLESGGLASSWRPATRRHVGEGYGCWLSWLQAQGYLGDDDDPGGRLTRDRLGLYIEVLRARVAPATVETRLVGLDRALAVMAPDADRTLLRRAICRLHDPHAGAAGKRKRLRDIRELSDLGRRLMAEAEDPSRRFLRPLLRPILYRDGLMIAFLAARPLRRRNFAGLVLGHHLVRVGNHWWIEIPPDETKTCYEIDEPFPDDLVESLEHYVGVHRPALLKVGTGCALTKHQTGPLWISSRSGGMMSGHTINLRIGEHTQRAFGRPVNMHLFRDCAATSIAIRDPEHIRTAAAVLGHRQFATTEKYYNLARSLEAAVAYHELLEHLRRGK